MPCASDSAPRPRIHWHRRVWTLTWPMLLANLSTPLVGAVDTAVMGRLPDPAYIGAVAVGAAMFNAIYWMFGFLRMGTTGLVAQAFGGGRPAEIAAIAARAVIVGAGLGVLLVALGRPLAVLGLWIFPASAQVEDLAATYLTLRIWGAPALLSHFAVLGALFGLQRMGAALLVTVLLNVANVALDLLFVVVLGWGVEGVALGTAISEWLAAGVGLVLLVRILAARGAVRPSRAILLQRDRLLALFGVSANLIVRSFFVQLPFFAFTVLGAGLGDRTLAANAVLLQLFFFMSFGLDALAHTAETLTGNAFGARDRATLRSATAYTLGWSLLVALAVSGFYALGGGALIDLLTTLPEVRASAREYLPWMVVAPLVAVGAFHLDGVFIGTTRTVELRNSMFVAVLCFIATAWLTLDPLGNHGLWLAMTVFMIARTLLLAARYPRLERLAAP